MQQIDNPVRIVRYLPTRDKTNLVLPYQDGQEPGQSFCNILAYTFRLTCIKDICLKFCGASGDFPGLGNVTIVAGGNETLEEAVSYALKR